MIRGGQSFQYGARLLDILDVTDPEQSALVHQNLNSGQWVLAANDKLYAEKNLLIIERPIIEIPEFPVGLASNIWRQNEGEPVKAVAIPAPKLIDAAYKEVLQLL